MFDRQVGIADVAEKADIADVAWKADLQWLGKLIYRRG